MAIGSCFCGQIRIEFQGQPLLSGLCHCLDCRKLTGSPYSHSYVVQTEALSVSGSPKEVAKKADSGNDIKNYFCPDCGTPLFGRKIKSNGDPDEITIVRAGIFENAELMDEWAPQAELYTDRRAKWVKPLEGTGQYNGMLSLS